MPIFDVAMTVKPFKKLEDGSQVQIERALFNVSVVAVAEYTAVAVALAQTAVTLSEEDLSILNSGTVIVRKMG